MKPFIKIYADFNNTDSLRRVRLNTVGTLNDLQKKNITLESDLEIILDDDEGLVTSGLVQFSDEEDIWVAKIDWEKFVNVSE